MSKKSKKDKKGINPTPPSTDPQPCHQCGSEKDVSYCIEPYNEDVNGKTIWMWLCRECYHNNCMDI